MDARMSIKYFLDKGYPLPLRERARARTRRHLTKTVLG